MTTSPVPPPPVSAGPTSAALGGRSLLTADLDSLRDRAAHLEARLRDPALRNRHVVASDLEDVRRELARRRDDDPAKVQQAPRFGPAGGSELARVSDEVLASHQQWLQNLLLRADPFEQIWLVDELRLVEHEQARRKQYTTTPRPENDQ